MKVTGRIAVRGVHVGFDLAPSPDRMVTSGGRSGGVLGEDPIELSAGASNCTSQCQAQARIRGSLPVPPLPTDPTRSASDHLYM